MTAWRGRDVAGTATIMRAAFDATGCRHLACGRGRYKAIGGGSPLRRITEEQAEALSQALRRKGQEASVYVAMRYWKPFTEDAIEQACDSSPT